jgi:hypothetical protein
VNTSIVIDDDTHEEYDGHGCVDGSQYKRGQQLADERLIWPSFQRLKWDNIRVVVVVVAMQGLNLGFADRTNTLK